MLNLLIRNFLLKFLQQLEKSRLVARGAIRLVYLISAFVYFGINERERDNIWKHWFHFQFQRPFDMQHKDGGAAARRKNKNQILYISGPAIFFIILNRLGFEGKDDEHFSLLYSFLGLLNDRLQRMGGRGSPLASKWFNEIKTGRLTQRKRREKKIEIK